MEWFKQHENLTVWICATCTLISTSIAVFEMDISITIPPIRDLLVWVPTLLFIGLTIFAWRMRTDVRLKRFRSVLEQKMIQKIAEGVTEQVISTTVMKRTEDLAEQVEILTGRFNDMDMNYRKVFQKQDRSFSKRCDEIVVALNKVLEDRDDEPLPLSGE